MRVGEILAELCDDYTIHYEDKKKEFTIGEYTFSHCCPMTGTHENDELPVSYTIWKSEDDFELIEDKIDATPEAVRQVLEHEPSWWRDSWSYDD